jgi:hypothetical protein
MITLQTFQRLRTTKSLLLAGGVALMFSGLLMYSFTLQIREVKDIALPAALALPSLEKRLFVLQEQTELGELQEAIGNGSQDEKVRMYILPPKDEIDRLIQTFDLFLARWQQKRIVTHVTPLSVGTASGITLDGADESLFATGISFEADVTPEGLDQLLLFIDLAGNLTVNDAFDATARTELLRLTEEENPAAVTALEQFLSSDLLAYVKDPGATERQLLRAFTSNTFADAFRQIIAGSQLPKAEALFSKDILSQMEDGRLWPVRMLRIKGLSITPVTDQLSHVALTLEAMSRGK